MVQVQGRAPGDVPFAARLRDPAKMQAFAVDGRLLFVLFGKRGVCGGDGGELLGAAGAEEVLRAIPRQGL